MIDKLDVRIPKDAFMTPEFRQTYLETKENPKYWHRAEHYSSVADLRPFGYEAILHVGLRHRRSGPKGGCHKLELIDAGQRTAKELLAEIERIFETPIRYRKSTDSEMQPKGTEQLQLMRIDLAADVDAVPVNWFRAHMRVAWKRRLAEIGQYMVITQGEGETLYYGKRPNCLRVYNKTAELRVQHKRLTRSVSPDAEIPDFEQLYGTSADHVLTRVERQIGGGKLPERISTLSQLKNLPEFDPFSRVEILSSPLQPVAAITTDCELALAGERFRQMVAERGLQRAQQEIRLRFPHNPSRTLKRLAPFAVSLDNETGITKEKLLELYRESVTAQLVA